MASAVLGVVGGIVGSMIPGLGTVAGYSVGAALGAAIGGAIGTYIDSYLFAPPATHTRGPQLKDGSTQDSSYGVPIPRVFGTYRLAGNVIWKGPFKKHAHVEEQDSGGKGGKESSTVTTYKYSCSFAVGICEGPLQSVRRIWADGTLIWDAASAERASAVVQDGASMGVEDFAGWSVWDSAPADAGPRVRVYLGGADQMPDSLMEQYEGVGEVPAYRGLAYVVLEDLMLENYGNRLPQLSFEVSRSDDGSPTLFDGVDAGGPVAGRVAGTPHALNDGRWAVVYEKEGRFHARMVKKTPRGDGMSVVAEIPGPEMRVVGEVLSSARSPSGRFVAVAARHLNHYGPDGGVEHRAQVAIWDSETRIWLDGGVREGVGHGMGGQEMVWVGEYCVCLTGAYATGSKAIWPWWADLEGGQLKQSAGVFRSLFLAGQPVVGGQTLEDCSAAPLTAQSSLLLFDAVSGYKAESWGLVATHDGLGNVALGPLSKIADTSLGYWDRRVLWTRVGDELLLCASSSAPGTPPVLLTLRVTGGVPSVARPAWSPAAGAFPDCPSVAYCGGGRIAAVGWMPGSDQQQQACALYGLTADGLGFEVRREVAPLKGAALAPYVSRFTGTWGDSAQAGYVALWSASTGRIQLLRAYGEAERVPLDQIVAELLERAGYAPGDYDVSALGADSLSGYLVAAPTAARNAIEPLMQRAAFDLIESDGRLKAKLRAGDAVATIPDAEGGAKDGGGEGEARPPYERLRSQEMDLPRQVTVRYMDTERDFQSGSQDAVRLCTDAVQESTLDLPMAMTAAEARHVAEQRLYQTWAERETVSGTTTWAWAHLEPGDVVSYRGFVLRLTTVKLSGGRVEWTGTPVRPLVYGGFADTDANPVGQELAAVPPTTLRLLDLPALRDSEDQLGLHYVVSSPEARWPGAVVMRSRDGVSWLAWDMPRGRAVVGATLGALGEGPLAYWDDASRLRVQVPWGELESLTEDGVLNGGNAALVGSEVVQFRTATLIAQGVYELSGFLRGRRGTDWAIPGHAAGEAFVLLRTSTLGFAPLEWRDLGMEIQARAPTIGITVNRARTARRVATGETLRPLRPVHLRGEARPDGTLSVAWTRRARVRTDWTAYGDVPVDEAAERYAVELFTQGGHLLRAVEVGEPRWDYTAAMRVADGIAPSEPVRVRVAQVSTHGLGPGRSVMATLA